MGVHIAGLRASARTIYAALVFADQARGIRLDPGPIAELDGLAVLPGIRPGLMDILGPLLLLRDDDGRAVDWAPGIDVQPSFQDYVV
jgi:hypothetical protein